jgi:hypothetical protein
VFGVNCYHGYYSRYISCIYEYTFIDNGNQVNSYAVYLIYVVVLS